MLMRMPPERLVLCVLVVVWTVYHVFLMGKTQQRALDMLEAPFDNNLEKTTGLVDLSLGMGLRMVSDRDAGVQTHAFIENSDEMRRINMENIQVHEQSVKHRLKVDFSLRSLLGRTYGTRSQFNTLLQVFSPEIRCPSMRKLGILGEEGRWFCGVSTFLDVPGCIIYIISSDGPLAFIRELVSATKCELHVFDPSITDQKKTWLKRLYNRIYFYNYTLGAAEATLVNFDGDNGVEEVQQKPLMDVMRSLGHSWLDALSANVDMDTWGWISAAHPSSLPITQTILRVDHGGQIKGFVQMLGSLMEGGFRIFNVDLSLQHSEPLDTIVVSFAKINQNGAISLRAATNFAQDTK